VFDLYRTSVVHLCMMVHRTSFVARMGQRVGTLLVLYGCGGAHDTTKASGEVAAAGRTAAESGEAGRPNAEPATREADPPAPGRSQPDAGSTPPSAASSPAADSGTAKPPPATTTVSAQAIEIEQHLSDVRPEFVDYLWNNLDAEHFEQWLPAEHDDFAWQAPPQAPGDLGAEPGAEFRSRELIGGEPHELVVRYLDRAEAGDLLTLDYAMVADVTIDGQGPVRWIVQYTTDGDWNLLVKQRLETPPVGSAEAWSAHLEARMANLTTFLKAWFQQSYVETELMRRGERKVTVVGDAITGDFEIVVTQHIAKVSADMIDWWWDNILDSMRYHRWHPIAHKKFTWTTPPKNTTDLEYDVGAVQQIVEIIGDENTLDITWLSPANLPIELTYKHFVYGSTMLSPTPFGGFLLHEYDDDPELGGIHMKSTFRLPALAGMPFAEALAAHCTQEMQFLQYFVPEVFAAEYRP
jgi:hypothetical protein